jgi:hypothetical protein
MCGALRRLTPTDHRGQRQLEYTQEPACPDCQTVDYTENRKVKNTRRAQGWPRARFSRQTHATELDKPSDGVGSASRNDERR